MGVLQSFSLIAVTALSLGLAACQKPEQKEANSPVTRPGAPVKT